MLRKSLDTAWPSLTSIFFCACAKQTCFKVVGFDCHPKLAVSTVVGQHLSNHYFGPVPNYHSIMSSPYGDFLAFLYLLMVARANIMSRGK